jgi:hypothetical protein
LPGEVRSFRGSFPGDVDAAIRVIDDFGWHKSLLINVGERRAPILECGWLHRGFS